MNLAFFKDIILKRDDFIKNRESTLLDVNCGKKPGLSLIDFSDYHKIFGLNKQNDNTWKFAEWAPNAEEMFITGDMTCWKIDEKFKLKKDNQTGIFSGTFSEKTFKHNQHYKLIIISQGIQLERIPTASQRVVQDHATLIFTAQVWDPERQYNFKNKNRVPGKEPLLIYEAHVGMAVEEGRVGTYKEFEENMLPRIKQAGYNTLQLMAILEHPYYGSLGYHVTSFFAPCSRFGTPEELKSLIDTAHGYGITVLIDMIHSHAANNETEGLSKFDNTYFQFFPKGENGFHPLWDSRCFDYGKDMVIKFLLSNLRYWLEEFNVDGFRFDGITSMLFYDHGINKNFTSHKDYFGNNFNVDALAYLYMANKLIHTIYKKSITIAEDISGYPMLALEQKQGGTGFDYRFAMGIADFWIKLLKDKKDEQWHLGTLWYELTRFPKGEKSISYSESHDQALVGDKTIMMHLLGKDIYNSMSLENDGIRTFRAIALHKMIRLITIATAQNGYLNFMGNEFGHPEWIDFPSKKNNWSYNYARRLWSLMYNKELYYSKLAFFDKSMLLTFKKYIDFENSTAQLLFIHEHDKIIIFKRKDLIFVFSFNCSKSFVDYRFNAPPGKYEMVLNTDQSDFGGKNRLQEKQTHFTIENSQLSLYIPTRTALILLHKK